MTRPSLPVEECCAWCRQPVRRCSDSSCDDTPTYGGILLRGEWQELRAHEGRPEARAAAV